MKNNDIELIQRVLEGDDDAFSVLVRKYQKQVHALAWRKIGDFHIAEEITQDTFLKAYKRLSTLKEPQRFVSWLYVIATNRCSSWLRKKRLLTQSFEHLEQTDNDELEEAVYSDYLVEEKERTNIETQRDVVKKLLAKLQDSERTVMTLHYFGEMSCPEIGAFLGVSANTVKSRLRRAQQRLQKEETMIREALDNFKISPILTENIMREISRMKPTVPSGSKPLMPWTVAASTLVVMLLILGFGNSKYMTRFQQPYSFDATAEMTVEIVDAPIVANLESNPNVRSQVGFANAQDNIENPEQQPSETTDKVAETQTDEIDREYTQWELPKAAKARLGKGGINVLQYSPDGSKLAVGSNIGVWIYDVKTGKEVTMFPGACKSLAFSPDGRFLANGGGMFWGKGKFSGNEVKLYDVVTGQTVSLAQVIPPSPALHFSLDSKTLYSVRDWGETIGIIDVETGDVCLKNIGGRPKRISQLDPYALTQDKLAAVRDSGEFHIWDMISGEKLSTLRGNKDKTLVLAFSHDGTQLASGSDDNAVHIWNIASNDKPIILREVLQKSTGWTNVIAFSPDGMILASGSTDKIVRLWDITTGKLIGKLKGHFNGIAGLTFSPDGETLASASTDGTILFWNTKTGNQLHTKITGHIDWIKGVTFLEDSTTLVSVAFNGGITHWDITTSQNTTLEPKTYHDMLLTTAFLPDGTKFVSVGAKGNVLFEAGYGVFYSSTMSDEVIRMIDVNSGRELQTLTDDGVGSLCATFSSDGKTVALGSYGKIRLWNTEADSYIDVPLSDNVQINQDSGLVFPRGPEITVLDFSPDGRKLICGSMDGRVQTLDAGTGIELSTVLTGQNQKNVRMKDAIKEENIDNFLVKEIVTISYD
ncbi:sigma-70 family RNA polymerase sigma factor, partial [Candidatus Poribacteria bacterium]|nr:sigma-70 family RNA polymerase sigma factor [Candidatus Poribacteria bacterium]